MSEISDSDPYFQLQSSENPAAIIRSLREEDPVHYIDGMDAWYVTRYDDVRRLCHDPQNVSRDQRDWEHFVPKPEGSMYRWFDDEGLQALTPEQHTRIRGLAASAFTPRGVRRMEAQIREVVERFAAPLRGRNGDVIDLVAEFTEPIPNCVISYLTGVPPAGDDEARFRELALAIMRPFLSFSMSPPEAESEAAFRELADWVREMATERRGNPRQDLITDLVQARDQGHALTDDEIVLLVTVLVAAGSETTAGSGLKVIETLLESPDQMKRIRDDRSLVPNAVNEVMRWAWSSGVGIPPRYAARDFELRGKQIRKGQLILLSGFGAHRDPSVFEDPDRFDLQRENKNLLVFGYGPHFCIGANLARHEMGCMLDAALDFLPAGSRICDERREFLDVPGFALQRALNFPVEIARD